VPGPLLVRALNYINTSVATMVAEIRAQGLARSTAIIISAKHGQSPTNPADLKRVPDSPIVAAVNAAWTKAHPGAGALVIFETDDDGMLWWLSNRSQPAASFVKHYLLTHTAAGNTSPTSRLRSLLGPDEGLCGCRVGGLFPRAGH
jgi:hypothetical protein